jgi:hypothetical protein
MKLWPFVMGFAFASAVLADDDAKVRLRGAAWFEYGRIGKAEDTLVAGVSGPLTLKQTGEMLQSLGAQATLHAEIGDRMEAALGFGAYKATHAQGQGANSYLAISLFQNFITQSQLTYYVGGKTSPFATVTVGAFPYKYQPDVNNLGLYLFRGAVYPGILVGGFKDPTVDTTRASQLGLRIGQELGAFSHDLVFNSERDIPPTFDWSLGYVAKYTFGDQLATLGFGFNLYRLIAYNEASRRPGTMPDVDLNFLKSRYVDMTITPNATNPAVFDTSYYYYHNNGTKVGVFGTVDLKEVVSIAGLGKEDLKLYSEAAVIGVANQGQAYKKISERIPVMVGFNLPVFGFLDKLSIEVEHYGAKYRNDLARIGNTNGVADWTTQRKPIPSAKPTGYEDYGFSPEGYVLDGNGEVVLNGAGMPVSVKGTVYDAENLTTDDWKWSLNLEKTLHGRMQISAQLANDHYRPRPVATGLIFSNAGTATTFAGKRDWYVMMRMGYFF